MARTPCAGRTLLARELRSRRGALVRISLWSAVESLPSLLSGLVVSRAVDRFLAGDARAGVGLLSLLVVAAAVAALATRQVYPWLARVVEPVRDALLTAVVAGSVAAAAADHRPDSAIIARLTEQVQSVRNVLFGLLRTGRQILFTFVAALVGLVLLSPVLALATAVLVAAAIAVLVRSLPVLTAHHRAANEATEDVARQAGAILGGVRDVIACGAESRAVDDAAVAIDHQVACQRALARAGAVRHLVVFVGGQLPLVVLLASAPWSVRAGHLTLGEVVGAATYLAISLEPTLRTVVGLLGSWGIDLVVKLGQLGRGFAAAAAPAAQGSPFTGQYDLAVRDLTFSYGEHADPVVRDLNFSIAMNGHLAVVGSSGIGKSTLANLLAGLLTPQRGAVQIGGTDVARLRTEDLRRLFGLIPQESYVFTATLRENLAYLADGVTDGQLCEAAAATGLQPVVERLGGLDAVLDVGGGGLSAGEKQLIALTRVYVSPARVVVLDEATCHLDPAAEARAESAFARRPGTLIVIAHRLSSARRAGQVLLIDGDAVRLGTHSELVRTSAVYAELAGHWAPDLLGISSR